MKVRKVVIVVLALVLSVFGHAVGHAQDEPPGQGLEFQTNVGSGYNCGRASTPLYCYGIPVNIGTGTGGNGKFWLDTYVTGYNAGTGFVLFMGVADLGEGLVTSNVPTTNSSGQITKLILNFHGSTNDGDNGTYTGTMTLTFSYYYSSGGGGRGEPGRVGALYVLAVQSRSPTTSIPCPAPSRYNIRESKTELFLRLIVGRGIGDTRAQPEYDAWTCHVSRRRRSGALVFDDLGNVRAGPMGSSAAYT
jgi:hypothetical protein